MRLLLSSCTAYFYPRPPGGGRRAKTLPFSSDVAISIHALRVEGDLGSACRLKMRIIISIHALRVEGDDSKAPEFCIRIIISIHALRVEGDKWTCGRRC